MEILELFKWIIFGLIFLINFMISTSARKSSIGEIARLRWGIL